MGGKIAAGQRVAPAASYERRAASYEQDHIESGMVFRDRLLAGRFLLTLFSSTPMLLLRFLGRRT